jgi:hypothetical protein
MTAEPTTKIVQPTFAPQGPAPYGAGPQYAPPTYGPPPAGLGYPFPEPPAPKRSVGKIVAAVASAIVVLAGIATAALFLLAPRTVEPESVQREIVRITQTAVGVAPTDVKCPEGVKAETGGTFTCTGTVDGQPVNYFVTQDDDKGHLTITNDRIVKLSEVESVLAQKVGSDVGVPVTVSCEPAGKTVVVNAPGTPIACTATNAADSSDSAGISVTVAADGTPAYTFA